MGARQAIPLRRSPVPRSRRLARGSAFTLIELILVMAHLTIAVSMTAPTLSRFFRGRILDSEARRLLALTRQGQSRAASEGLPMDLWVDADKGQIGLRAEPSYEEQDPKEVEYELHNSLRVEVENKGAATHTNTPTRIRATSMASVPRVVLVKPGLPTIRFLPDGSLGENSPQSLRLIATDGSALWLKQSRNRLTYEIAKNPDE